MDSSYSYSYGTDGVTTTSTGDPAAVFALVGLIFTFIIVLSLIIAAPTIIGLWKLFTKAGKPGWAAIVPVYNVIVWCEVVGRPLWWALLLFVPVAQIFVSVALCIDLAKAFGKDIMFGILLILFEPIVLLVLAFDKNAHYVGPVAAGTDMFSSFSSHPHPAPAAPVAPVAPTPPVEPQPETPVTTSDENKTV